MRELLLLCTNNAHVQIDVAMESPLHILLTPNKEHKKLFPNVPVIGFRNGKSLKDYLVRATLPNFNEIRRCEPCGKKTCLVCDCISTATTFTTEASQETFKIQSAPLTCDSEKVLYLLKCKICGEVPYVEKAKTKFRYRFNNYKSKHRAFRKGNRKVSQKLFHTHYCFDVHSGIEDCDFVIFEQCETYEVFETQKYLALVFFFSLISRFQLNRNVIF